MTQWAATTQAKNLFLKTIAERLALRVEHIATAKVLFKANSIFYYCKKKKKKKKKQSSLLVLTLTFH